ncbi:hypothetical protein GpartN1_g1180.t1 [Galdieria partita]|uniref:Uncharacterized protein n=1 Tax=Galdieria partita TaxID=83374 RepID=A0A9C7PS01_9RHOD|nr:hypothetical protein GpartN1_g1180.t1 [Galdieria partita]
MWLEHVWKVALFSGSFAGLLAILITLGIESFGGLYGGIIGSLPGTIVPASIGIWNQCDRNAYRFRISMFSSPIGLATNSVFLLSWRVVPPLLPAVWSLKQRLGAMILISFFCWFLIATAVLYFTQSLYSLFQVELVGGLAAVLKLVLGIAATWKPPPTPASSSLERVSKRVLLFRGFFAFLAVFVAVLLSHVNDFVAGVAAVFPAVFSTTMIAVWISAGEAVQGGAVGPMMMGTCCGSAYTILCGLLIPEWGVTMGVLSAWSLAVVFVSIPAFFWVRWRLEKAKGSYQGTVEDDWREKESEEELQTYSEV